jgi:hypothetical protein
MPEDTHVHTVQCSVCSRPWTGEFYRPLPDYAICRDCLRKDPAQAKGHKDIHIQRSPEFAQYVQ